jgi:hypothetical protein
MEILKKVAAVPGHVIEKVADKVSATRDHARDAFHRVIDRVEDFVGMSEPHLAGASGDPAPTKHLRKERGHKKPRAERRRARRAARHER